MGLNQIVLLAAKVQDKSMGERIGKGLSDSAMSIIIVFAVLFLISIIISSFRLINKYEAKLNGAKEAKVDSSSANVVSTSIPLNESLSQSESKELVDDLELVAVITAAIYEYEEACGNTVTANGLYVRSIKKVNTKWRNA